MVEFSAHNVTTQQQQSTPVWPEKEVQMTTSRVPGNKFAVAQKSNHHCSS